MKAFKVILTVALIGVLFGASSAMAFSGMFYYSGKLTDDVEVPITGTVSITFSLYDVATGGSPVWTEAHGSVNVDEGSYTVMLGSITPNLDLEFDGNDKWLGITVGSDSEMIPRHKISSMPYAMNADRLDGKHVSEFGDGHSLDAADSSPTDALYVDNDGKVGIGTTSPARRLHLYNVPSGDPYHNMVIGDGTYGLVLGNGTGSGYAPCVWGHSYDSNDALTLFSDIDPTDDTGNQPAVLIKGRRSGPTTLSTRPLLGIANNNSLKIVVDKNGWLGIGTATPSAMLDVTGPSELNGPVTVNNNVGIYCPTNSGEQKFRVGDDTNGFDIGNGTSNGFAPIIWGRPKDSNDVLWLLSEIPPESDTGSQPVVAITGRRDAGHQLHQGHFSKLRIILP